MEIVNEKEIFNEYEEVRQSGVTNMYDIRVVSTLSGLTKEEIIYVMEHYSELKRKYGIQHNVSNEIKKLLE